jgi:hypothetical protein
MIAVMEELFDVYHSKIIVVSYSKLIVPHPKPHPIPGAKQMLETGPSDDQILKIWMVPSHPYQVNNQTHACCIVGPMELQTDLDVAFPEGGRGIYLPGAARDDGRPAKDDGKHHGRAEHADDPPALMCTRLDDNINSIVLSLI